MTHEMVKAILCTMSLLAIVAVRTAVCEIFIVSSCSMVPTIQPTEIYCVDKISGGALMPRRLAEIPIVNVFTWISPLRIMDEKNNWGYRRIPGFRKYKKGDVILFRALDGSKNILVKRIEHIYKDEDNGDISYYVLGDNRNNSADSRCFGLVPDSLVVGMARRVLFSWDNEAKGLNKVRWKRIGYDITESKGDMQRDDE